MLEIIVIFFFTRKVRSIAEKHNVPPKKWLLRLVLTWFGVEALTIGAIMLFTGNTTKDGFLMASLVGILLAIISAFYNISVMMNEMNKTDGHS